MSIPEIGTSGISTISESWALTRELSPRRSVRVSDTDAYGAILNAYTGTGRVEGAMPQTPWAMNLADTRGQYHFICFDLDAKNADGTTRAARDAAELARLLNELSIEHIICDSGGDHHGRHVWIGLAETAAAETIALLARLARSQFPSLDIAPISNAAAGCVRPPGAPHRNGRTSTVLTGSLDTLRQPTTTAAAVANLIGRLSALVSDAEPQDAPEASTPLPLDPHARLYLPGPKRPLAARAAAALTEDAAQGDASAVLWQVLIGAAAAHWRYADIAALTDSSPGLEHVRTHRDSSGRTRRSRTDAQRVLRRQWDKAVKFVAASKRQVGDDPTFEPRAYAVAQLIEDVQQRADAAVGRWSHGGGPADRRVLDALCLLVLRAVSATVEADIRRVALTVGIGRETARTALLRLAEDGWIEHAKGAEGARAAHWKVESPALLHRDAEQARSQADPRPPQGAGSALRSLHTETLTTRLAAASHDLFTTAPALGHLAGNIYSRCTTEPQSFADLLLTSGASPVQLSRALDRLSSFDVLTHTGQGWLAAPASARDVAADRLSIAGRLEERARRYSIERELWAWWQAEQTWMEAPRRAAANRRPGPGQLALVPMPGVNTFGAHPRRADGRADYRSARAHVVGGLTADAPAPMPTLVESEAERLVREILGGELVETLPNTAPQAQTKAQARTLRARHRSSYGSQPSAAQQQTPAKVG